ncbi:MAG: aldo/keto reductase [Actinomycetota bacterium]
MRTARIGVLEVSTLGLGCNNFGRGLDPDGTRAVVRAALDAGVTFFDTASNYGGGRSEDYLSRALGPHRSRVVIATKFGTPVPGRDDSGGAAPSYIERMVERSLRQLRTDYIDLYQLHRPDPRTPIEDTLETLAGLVEKGKVRQIGCSNLDASQLAEALAISSGRGFPRFVADQVHYSLIHRDPETDGLAEVCRAHNVGLVPYYPLAVGLLTGKVRPGERPGGRIGMERYRTFLTPENFAVVERLRVYARDRGLTPAQVALGWLMSRPEVPTVPAGAMTPEQLRSNLGAAEWEPTPEDLSELDRLSRRSEGHGGADAAPEGPPAP